MPTRKIRVTVDADDELTLAWSLRGTLYKEEYDDGEYIWGRGSALHICYRTLLGKRIFEAAKKAPQVIEVTVRSVEEK